MSPPIVAVSGHGRAAHCSGGDAIPRCIGERDEGDAGASRLRERVWRKIFPHLPASGHNQLEFTDAFEIRVLASDPEIVGILHGKPALGATPKHFR